MLLWWIQGSSALASLARTTAPLNLELRFACSRQEDACLNSSPHPIELRFQLVLLGVPCMVLRNLLSLRYARDSRTTDST